MAQAIPNLCVCRRVLLKHRVNWSAVCDAIGVCLGKASADNPVERLNVHLSLLVEPFVLTNKVIHMRNKDKPWFKGIIVKVISIF